MAASSTLDNIDESIYGIKAKTTTVKGSDVSVTVDDNIQINGQDILLRGELVGTINKDATELNATWTQTEPAQAPVPLQLKHAAAQAATAPATRAGIAGDWEGTLNAGPAKLRLVLHLVEGKDGGWTATLDSVDQGANGIPVSSVTVNGSKLNLTMDAVHGTYEGTINKDTSEIDGTWTQNQPLDLIFRRTQPHVAPKPGKPSDIDGTWQGTLATGGPQLRILFRIVNMDNGLAVTLQSPDQSPAWLPATSVARSGDNLTITFDALGATYEGKIATDRSSIEGKFTQMGREMPLVVKKS
jgi:hypothetical protein